MNFVPFRLRKRLALWICPELQASKPATFQSGQQQAILALYHAYSGHTGRSHWEICEAAGVNNRAIQYLEDGRTVQPRTLSKLFWHFEAVWPAGLPWPIQEGVETGFFIPKVPVIERLGGVDAVIALLKSRGITRSRETVLTWPRRRGVPRYAQRIFADHFASLGIEINESDYLPSKAEVTRALDTDRPEVA